MLAQLVKVANRLDSLGLTKEADILDLEIIRLASDSGPGKTRVQLAEESVTAAQEAFDNAAEEFKKSKSVSARAELNKAKIKLEEANSELQAALAIQNVYPEESTEETPPKKQPFAYPQVVEKRRMGIRGPSLEEYPNMNIPEETNIEKEYPTEPSELAEEPIIEKEYPTKPKELADLDPDSFYVFQVIKPKL